MDKFGERIKEALNEATKGFEVSDEMKEAAVCHFHRQAGRPDNGNYLEREELRGNMLYSRFVQWDLIRYPIIRA